MCMLCVDWIKGSMSKEEVRRNLAEMAEILDTEHVEEVEKLLAEYSPEKYETI